MKFDNTVAVNGPRIRALRKLKGWSQERLAFECEAVAERTATTERLSCSRGSVQSLEAGRRSFPSTVMCVAMALGVAYRMLLADDGQLSAVTQPLVAGSEQKLDIRLASQILERLSRIERSLREIRKNGGTEFPRSA